MEWIEKFVSKGADFLLGVIVGAGAVLGIVWKAISDGKLLSGTVVDRMTRNQQDIVTILREERRCRGDGNDG